MDPTLVLFAIQAGVLLGRKIYDIFVEKNFNRPFSLPLGEFVNTNVLQSEAILFFDENKELIKSGGPLHDIWDGTEGDPLKAYNVLHGLHEMDCSWTEARQIIAKMQKFEQLKDSLGKTKPGLQQLLGFVVETGIDFLKINPFFKIDSASIQSGSTAQRVIGAFVTHLDEIDFEDKNMPEMGRQVFKAGLEVFGESSNLITRDERLQFLFRDITQSLVEDNIFDPSEMKDNDLLGRIAGSVLRGAMNGITEDPALFIRGYSKDTQFVRTTVTGVLTGLKGQKNLFSPASLEIIFKNAMAAVSESAELITKDTFLQELIQDTLGVLTEAEPKKIFTEATYSGIVAAALESVAHNAGALIQTTGPQRLFLVEGLEALSESLGTILAGGEFKKLFTSTQLLDLTRVVFGNTAQHPEALLGESKNPSNSLMAKIITTVSGAIQNDPNKLISADGYLHILDTALRVGAQNADDIAKKADKILTPIDQHDPLSMPLYNLLKGLLESAPKLAGSLHSGNFPAVFEKVLMQYLLSEWSSSDAKEIFNTAKAIVLTL